MAALSAISAFAQSSVQITGYFDRGYTTLNSTKAADSTKTLGSSAGTTRIEFRGTEDLGSGNTAGFFVETDWADLGGSTQTASVTTGQKAGFANSENYLSLGNANVGTLKLGAPNSFTLGNAIGVASPAFSTGVGSAYNTKFSIANGVSTGADAYAGIATDGAPTANNAAAVGARAIRIANTVQYVSPTFYGVTAGINLTPQNNNVTAAPGNGNTVGVKEYSLAYSQGPLNAQYTSIRYTVGDNGTSQYTLTLVNAGATYAPTSKPLTGGLTSKQDLLGANYQVLPSLKLHAGLGKFSSSNDAVKGKSTQYGVTYTYGAYDVLAQVAKVDDQGTYDIDRKTTGLGVNYNLSKTTRLYFRGDNIQYSTNQASFAGSQVKRTAFGLSKAF